MEKRPSSIESRSRWFLIAAVALAVGLLALAPPALTAKDGQGRTDEAEDRHRRDKHRDPRLPASWAGQWELTFTYQDTATHNIGAVDEITNVICAQEPVGLHLFDDQADCTGKVLGHRLAVRCTSQFREGLCRIKGALQLTVERSGDTLLGSGQWSATVSGLCGPLVSGGELIEVSGIRLTREQATCPQSRSSVLQKFGTHPALLMLIAQAEEDDDDRDDNNEHDDD
jgi:hypothetical protein